MVKKKAAPTSKAPPPSIKTDRMPGGFLAAEDTVQQQQKLLDIFKQIFRPTLSSDSFAATLQDIKEALFNRDFAGAFGPDAFLQVYAARWSPTRALCYASVLKGIRPHLGELYQTSSSPSQPPESSASSLQTIRVLSVGGGAAEIAAVARFLSQSPDLRVDLVLVDSAPWQDVTQRLYLGLTSPPELSAYASAAAKAANTALVAGFRMSASQKQLDALALEKGQLEGLVGNSPVLITLMFTLNELFTAAGVGKTTAFLLRLSAAVAPGSLLLVVDSPGSYAETVVGKQSRRYPMEWLLARVLASSDDRSWDKLTSEDSVWFRLAEELDYPIPLENMRYQMHLYRATEPSALAS